MIVITTNETYVWSSVTVNKVMMATIKISN